MVYNRIYHPKNMCFFIVAVGLLLLFDNTFSGKAGTGSIFGKTAPEGSFGEKSREVAISFLKKASENPLDKISSVNLMYDVFLECEWNILLKMSVTVEMKKEKNGYISSFKFTEPVGENLWGKLIMFLFGRHTEDFKKLIDAIKSTAFETFHLKNGKFATDELIEVLSRKKRRKIRKGIRIFFDYDEKKVKFWKDRSEKELTASVEYINQVGPMTGYFNFLFFDQPETEICVINQRRRAKYVSTQAKESFRKWKGDFIFTSQVIRLSHNNTGKHIEYNHTAYTGSDDFFDIVYGKYVYYNLAHLTGCNIKTPYAVLMEGLINKEKKRKKAKRLKKLKKKAKDRKSFEKELRAIEAMDILAARNVKLNLTKANVVYE